MEKKKKGSKKKEENILFDQDWQNPGKKIDPDVFLEQMSSVSRSSENSHESTTDTDGIYLEALLRIYLQSKSFREFFDVKEGIERIKQNCYEVEELFVSKKGFNIDEFLKVLNGGVFSKCFELMYSDKGAGNFYEGDLFIMEIRHSLVSLTHEKNAFIKFYENEMKKIQKMFLDWEKGEKKSFESIHVFLFYNREKAEFEFTRPLNYSKLDLNRKPRKIYFYYIYSNKKIIFFNMTGVESFTPSAVLGEILDKKKMEENLQQEILEKKKMEEKFKQEILEKKKMEEKFKQEILEKEEKFQQEILEKKKIEENLQQEILEKKKIEEKFKQEILEKEKKFQQKMPVPIIFEYIIEDPKILENVEVKIKGNWGLKTTSEMLKSDDENNKFLFETTLPPGIYTYKIQVNGKWLPEDFSKFVEGIKIKNE